MSNSRRRFLAFMGLMGAPAALWSPARAQDTTQEAALVVPITCAATDDTPARLISYSRDFHIDNGKLVSDEPAANYINQAALKASYAMGVQFVKNDSDPAGFNVRAPNFRIDNPGTPDSLTASFSAMLQIDTPPTDMNGRLTLADGTTENAYVKFYADSVYGGQIQIDTNWEDKSPLLMTKPVKVELIGDGKSLGKFTFDMSRIDWTPFLDYQDRRIGLADNVTFDADSGSTTVEGCTGSTGGGCFLTTAAVDTLGLSDDCWELRTLRRFRDGPLARIPGGQALTARYYACAPRLVEAVDRRADAATVWLNTYWTYILPCAVMTRFGLHRAAVAHYRRLFGRLERLA